MSLSGHSQVTSGRPTAEDTPKHVLDPTKFATAWEERTALRLANLTSAEGHGKTSYQQEAVCCTHAHMR